MAAAAAYLTTMDSEKRLVAASVPTLVLPEDTPLPSEENTQVVIRLDAAEERLFDTLLQAADSFQQGSIVLPNQQPHRIEIRVAGGWVRDKLLGRHTHDVDIAIDTVSGVDFATIVQLYLQREAPGEVHKMGVIAANPSQSKHLETATMVVYTIDVDFCNLRAQEIYESHSRIPTTRFGSPLEDAERRDFTVNALFFNLRTKRVEDWTGRGLQDLQLKVLVTPLNPTTTFHDDPLRVLRAIRFAVRYDMKLHPQLEEACRSPEVHETLHVKISRERVGKELEAMLSGKSAKPQQALETIGRLGLADSVFCLADNVEFRGSILGHAWIERDAAQLESMGWEEALKLMRLLPPVLDAHLQYVQSMGDGRIATEVDLRLVHLGVFLLPFRHVMYKDRKDKVVLVVSYMMRESIKFKNKDTSGITTIMETVDSMKEFLTASRSTNVRRLDAGLILIACKDMWVTCLLVATVLKINEMGEASLQEWIQASLNLYGIIVDMGLDECWKMKPLLNGQYVIQALELPRGPQVGVYLKEQQRWMLENPDGSEAECEEHLRRHKHELDRQDLESDPHVSKKLALECDGRRTSFP